MIDIASGGGGGSLEARLVSARGARVSCRLARDRRHVNLLEDLFEEKMLRMRRIVSTRGPDNYDNEKRW